MKKFLQTLGKTIAIALVFGLVSGLMFQATTYFLGEGFTSIGGKKAALFPDGADASQESETETDSENDENREAADADANARVNGANTVGNDDGATGDNANVAQGENKNTAEAGADGTQGQDGSSAENDANSEATQNAISHTALDVSDLAKQAMPSIVAITNISITQYQSFFGRGGSYESESCGSGIIVSQDENYIYVATNNHVVEDANSLTVQFCDDASAAGEIKGVDENHDLAVVQIEKEGIDETTLTTIRTATLGDSTSLKVGEPAVAIGNALGYGQSVTTGVISALNREVSVQDSSNGKTITNQCIQTDAAINPGNSGGALLNLNGEVIGINEVKYSTTSVEGIGYAIPMESAKPIIEHLIGQQEDDTAGSAYLGIYGLDVGEMLSQNYHMPNGVYVAQVDKNSPAEAAGIQIGDIITSFDGTVVTTKEELERAVSYSTIGETYTVTLKRAAAGNYYEKSIEVEIGKRSTSDVM